MKVFDFVAILGALAWLPHLINLIKDYFTIPEIRIITQRTAEIGYSTYGPIFNTRLAFATKKREIVISSLKIKLKHESGDERILSWQGILQRLAEMRYSESSSIPMEKEQSVLAIKLNPKEIEERLIRFQEDDYHNNKETYDAKAAKKLTYLREKISLDFDEYLKSEEMKDLCSFIKHWFNWKQGQYFISFEMESNDKFVLKDNEYTFSLNSLDIEVLEKNKDLIEIYYENDLKLFGIPDYKPIPVMWNWRNPIVKKQAK